MDKININKDKMAYVGIPEWVKQEPKKYWPVIVSYLFEWGMFGYRNPNNETLKEYFTQKDEKDWNDEDTEYLINVFKKNGYIIEKDEESDETKIVNLLKENNVSQEKIDKFVNALNEIKDDIEEMGDMQEDENKGQNEYNDFAENNNLDENDNKLKEIAKDEEQHEDFLLNAQNVALLKATQEGKELLINAPTMAKDELEKAIKEYLLKNKGE